MVKKHFSERETFLSKEVGFTYTTEELTVTKEYLDSLNVNIREPEDIFSDDAYAKSLGLNLAGMIIPGVYLVFIAGQLDMLRGLAFNAVMVGMNDIRFLSPAYIGDRLVLQGELITKRETSKGHTLVTWKWMLKNQNNTVVTTGVITEIFAKSLTN